MISNVLLPLLTVIAVVVVVGSYLLRQASPVAYWRLVGAPLTVMRMHWYWRSVCTDRGWTTQKRAGRVAVGGVMLQGRDLRPKVPLLRVRVRQGVITARVRIPPGKEVKTFTNGAKALQENWRVYRVKVYSPYQGSGYVNFDVQPFDSLGGSVQYAEILPRADDAVESKRAVSLVLALGIRDSGVPWMVSLRTLPHWLIVGATQSGKSSLLRTLIARLAVLPVAIIGVDLKGGLELGLYSCRLSALARTRAEAAEVFTKVLDIVLERQEMCRKAGKTAVWQLPDPPVPVVVIVDEIAELFLMTDRSEKELREITTTTMQRIAQLGAAFDVHLIASGQRVGSELGQGVTLLRSQLGGRVCLRVSDRESAEMALGDLSPDAVALAVAISPEAQGTAVTAEDSGGYGMVRGALMEIERAQLTADRFAHMRVVLNGLEPPGPMDSEDAEGETQ